MRRPSHDSPAQYFPPGSLAARLVEARAEQDRLRAQAEQAHVLADARRAPTPGEDQKDKDEDQVDPPVVDAPVDAPTPNMRSRYPMTRLATPAIRRESTGRSVEDAASPSAGERENAPVDTPATSQDGVTMAVAALLVSKPKRARTAKEAPQAPVTERVQSLIDALAADREQELAAIISGLLPASAPPVEAVEGAASRTKKRAPRVVAARRARKRQRRVHEAAGHRADRDDRDGGATARVHTGGDSDAVAATADVNRRLDGGEQAVSAQAAPVAEAEAAALRAQVQQARDELRAFRRRSELDKEEYMRFARGEALASMIPLLDDFDRALAHAPAGLRDDPWVMGVMMIGQSASEVLRSAGVERFDPQGAPFDPHRHEAVARRVEGDLGAGDELEHRVIRVYQQGYICNGRVLRPARVEVVTRSRQPSIVDGYDGYDGADGDRYDGADGDDRCTRLMADY